MNGKCFEIGTIQAFLDGETAPETTIRVANHIAACDNCSMLMAEAEEESSVVFSALEREMNTLVPTQRLWNRINESIAVEKSQTSVWQRISLFVFSNLANPSFAAAAGVLIVFGLFAAVFSLRSDTVNSDQQATNLIPQTTSAPSAPIEQIAGPGTGFEMPVSANPDPVTVKETNHSPENLKAMVAQAAYRESRSQPKPQYAVIRETYLPGEESYVKTISDLKQTVDVQKDEVLPPATRIAYERDMAVVDDAITKMKKVVQRNPRNQSARQVLYSSYQDKIDLLNSVAQREELMASLK